MRYAGKALCLGDHIDTDAIIPARFLVTSDPAELGTHCMEGLDPLWLSKVTPGKNLLVAGRNFGCGSSREHAPVAILGAGMDVVIAHSFARIFYRNAFNMGLLPLEVGDAFSEFAEGDEVEVDMPSGFITNRTTGKKVSFPPLPETMRAILEAGGLAPFVKKRLNGPASG
jgi:3-isopropylmalate/(R)-2-methylmalate dehydratase small subunit